jgi:hypothetical protein
VIPALVYPGFLDFGVVYSRIRSINRVARTGDNHRLTVNMSKPTDDDFKPGAEYIEDAEADDKLGSYSYNISARFVKLTDRIESSTG